MEGYQPEKLSCPLRFEKDGGLMYGIKKERNDVYGAEPGEKPIYVCPGFITDGTEQLFCHVCGMYEVNIVSHIKDLLGVGEWLPVLKV